MRAASCFLDIIGYKELKEYAGPVSDEQPVVECSSAEGKIDCSEARFFVRSKFYYSHLTDLAGRLHPAFYVS